MKKLLFVLLLIPLASFGQTAEDFFNSGNAKNDKEDYEGAIADYTKSIELDPNYAETYYLRGLSKKNSGDFKEAIVDFSKAIELNPDKTYYYNNLGITKDSLNDNLGAISAYSKAIAIWRKPEFIKNRLLSMRSSSDEYKLFMNAGIDSFYGELNLVCENKNLIDDQENVNNDEKVKEEDNSDVPFAVIEDVPRFMLCYLEKNSDARECFQEQMNAHIRRNFRYPEIAQEKNIQGRVYTNFIISECGYIKNIRVRGPDKMLEEEAIRIISLLPRMTPGKQGGKPVRVPFSIPITFRLQ